MCVGGGDTEADLWGCQSFCFPELCLHCWWPPGNHGGHENPGTGGRGDPWKSPAFPMAQTLWAPAVLFIPEPLKHLAETSLYHTPYDKGDGKAGRNEMDLTVPYGKPLSLSLLQGTQDLRGREGRLGGGCWGQGQRNLALVS